MHPESAAPKDTLAPWPRAKSMPSVLCTDPAIFAWSGWTSCDPATTLTLPDFDHHHSLHEHRWETVAREDTVS